MPSTAPLAKDGDRSGIRTPLGASVADATAKAMALASPVNRSRLTYTIDIAKTTATEASTLLLLLRGQFYEPSRRVGRFHETVFEPQDIPRDARATLSIRSAIRGVKVAQQQS